MSILLWFINILIIVCLSLLKWRQSRKNLYKCAENIPGPDGHPLLGMIPNVMGKKNDEIFTAVLDLLKPYGALAKAWLGPVLVVVVESPQYLKVILNSDKCLNKAFAYEFLGVDLGLIAAPCKYFLFIKAKMF